MVAQTVEEATLGKEESGSTDVRIYVPAQLREDFREACALLGTTPETSVLGFMTELDGFGLSAAGNQKRPPEFVRFYLSLPKEILAEFKEQCRANERNMTAEVRAHMERVVDSTEDLRAC